MQVFWVKQASTNGTPEEWMFGVMRELLLVAELRILTSNFVPWPT